MALVEGYEDYLGSSRYRVGKERAVIIAFSDDFWIFFFDTTLKFDNWYFLKTSLWWIHFDIWQN